MSIGLLILALLIGFVVGFFASKWSAGSKVAVCEVKRDDSKAEFDQYQAQVGSHIAKTSELLNQVEQSCQRLSNHVHLGYELQSTQTDSEVQPAASYARMINSHRHLQKRKKNKDKV